MARFESRHSFLIRGAEAFLRLEVGLVSAPGEGDDSAVLREDFPAHRAYVGAPRGVGTGRFQAGVAAPGCGPPGHTPAGRRRVRLPPGREDAHPLPPPRSLLRS